MICNKDIPVIDLVDANGRNILFGTDQTRYVVPIYQRSFAWGGANGSTKPDEIVQLIDDVLSSKGDYYLGSLVVSKCQQGEYDYEVIDGQQRLTALYLIFACLGFKLNPGSLGYACREDSAKVLGQLANPELDACFAGQDCDKRQEKEPSPLCTAPESLAGVRTRIADGETVLEYGELSLGIGAAQTDALSPVSGVQLLTEALRGGFVERCRTERDGETELIAAELYAADDTALTVWYDAETLCPQYCEFFRDGAMLLRCRLREFTFK